MYADLLKEKLTEQEKIYRLFQAGQTDCVLYREVRDGKYGIRDGNEINRKRLCYYLLYFKTEDEKILSRLFEEELKDRTTNSFQGIGSTLCILTYLIGKYNADHTYDPLLKAAAKANFDCICGYNPACQVSDNLYDNDLTDCIYLCQELDYPDVMKQLVSEWKDTVMKDTDSDRACLIRFHQFLGMEEENGPLYQAQLLSATETGRISDLARAYIDMIRHELRMKQYEKAGNHIREARERADDGSDSMWRLRGELLETAFELISSDRAVGGSLWEWAKAEFGRLTNIWGNVYTKGIEAARAMEDTYALELEKEYQAWREKMGLNHLLLEEKKGRAVDED